MIVDAVLSYAHFAAVFLVFGTLCAEAFVINLPPAAAMARLLARIDLIFGVSAALAVAAGLARVFAGAKGAAYYGAEPFFWAKLATFAVVGVISITPTMRFLAWGRALKTNPDFAPPASEVKSVRSLIMAELYLFALIPLFAALMARGIGA
jgi:putative membrane protein